MAADAFRWELALAHLNRAGHTRSVARGAFEGLAEARSSEREPWVRS
jgi:hypothetical protein